MIRGANIVVLGAVLWLACSPQAALGRTGLAKESASPKSDRMADIPILAAAGRGNPWMNLRDGFELPSAYEQTGELVAAPDSGTARPLALTSGDFDGDGVADIVAGYATPRGGALAIHRGNTDTILPDGPVAERRKSLGTFTGSPFDAAARLFAAPLPPEFMAAGDFNGDGLLDVVATSRGKDALDFFAGDGRGGFQAVETYPLPGDVTALTAGEIDRADGLQDLVVGVTGRGGAAVLIFQAPGGALTGVPVTVPLRDAVSALALGQFDASPWRDLIIAAGPRLILVHGMNRYVPSSDGLPIETPHTVESFPLLFTAVSLEVGDFIVDGRFDDDLAVLADDGTVHFMQVARTLPPGDPALKDVSHTEPLVSTTSHRPPRLVRARISGLAGEDLAVTDPAHHRIHVLPGGAASVPAEGLSPAGNSLAPASAVLELDAEPAALLPMQLNEDALSDLVVLTMGHGAPIVSLTAPLSTFTVNTTGDGTDTTPGDGVCGTGAPNSCSLRAAIMEANALAGADTIQFSIGAGTPTISPATLLPTIVNPVTILGNTGGATRVQINGAALTGYGLRFFGGSGYTLRAFVINRCGTAGVFLDACSGCKVENCYLGTDSAGGSTVTGNAHEGVRITGSGNTIGGPSASQRNVISNNLTAGITLTGSGASGNLVEGNYIGTNAAGTLANSNDDEGVLITAGAHDNTIGGSTGSPGSGNGNVISGNASSGVYATGSGVMANKVQGNLVGTTADGLTALGNTSSGDIALAGVRIGAGASDNLVGGTSSQFRNIISGHTGDSNAGVLLIGASADGNTVQGNWIGLNASGLGSLPNSAGVSISSASNTQIGGATAVPGNPPGNVICGNGDGVEIFGVESTNKNVQGNLIGLLPGGTAQMGNSHGVTIYYSALVGGTTVSARNVISGNTFYGVRILGPGNRVQGNYIGTNIDATSPIGNGDGVYVGDGSSGNLIGGPVASGLPGAPPGNVISGNRKTGVDIDVITATVNSILGNLIGTNGAGTAALSNLVGGILIRGSDNVIGGATTAERNVISGNDQPLSYGVRIYGSGNTIEGNFIGTDRSGVSSISNSQGVEIKNGDNVVGGPTAVPGQPPGNVISGNITDSSSSGVDISGTTPGSRVEGNLIGLNVNGAALANARGVSVAGSGANNVIGGTENGTRNIISGNTVGIEISGSSNTVLGNFIGTDIAGSAPRPNQNGVRIIYGDGNTIGGTTAAARNVVSGNSFNGISVETGSSNTVSGNFIGVDAGGVNGMPNGDDGVSVSGNTTSNMIGGTTGLTIGGCTGSCNVIANNGGKGAYVQSGSTNAIRGNSIYSNLGLGIDLNPEGVTSNDPGDTDAGANGLQNFPVITSASYDGVNTVVAGTLNSTPSTSFSIDVFGNAGPDPSGHGQGKLSMGSTIANTNGSGVASWSIATSGSFGFISATATSPAGDTSEFATTYTAVTQTGPMEARNLLASKGVGTIVNIAWTPACGATNHVVYRGTTPILGALQWTSSFCNMGLSGMASFNPGTPIPGKSFYFVIVGQSVREGSYGVSSAGVERPEAVGFGACDLPRFLTANCP